VHGAILRAAGKWQRETERDAQCDERAEGFHSFKGSLVTHRCPSRLAKSSAIRVTLSPPQRVGESMVRFRQLTGF
jgi:hypothetical protein